MGGEARMGGGIVITTDRQRLERTISEASYQSRIIDLAELYRWRIHHCRPLQRRDGRWQTPIAGDAGFPDLVLLRDRRLLVIEVKAERGQLSAEQRIWLERFVQAGAEVVIARPSNWEAIERMLR